MASIRTTKTKSGPISYQVLFRYEGKQTSDVFGTSDEAIRFKQLVEKVGAKTAREMTFADTAVVDELTVTEWITEHIDHLTGIEEATRKQYRRYLSRDIEPILGPLPLSAVNEKSLSVWVQSLKGSGKTVANKHGFLSGALAGAVRAKHLTSNPCDGRRLPSRDSDTEAVFLTPPEFALVRDTVPEHWQPFAVFLVTTGMRFSEATALRVSDIDSDERTARIVRAWKYTGEAKRKLGPPKSKKSRRTINLSDQAFDAMGDLKARKSSDYVFVNKRGTPITAQLFHNKAWRPMIVKLAGTLGKKPRPHDLRHSCASWMIAAGVPLPVIQQHLGHESITTTIGIYGHLDRRSAQAASKALTAALEGL